MSNYFLNEALFNFIQLGITYLVCSVVWIMLIVGVYQLILDMFSQFRLPQKRIRRSLPGQQVSH